MSPPLETIEVLPSPKRLIKSLRDVGYDFPGAVADLVDNSITAGASHVDMHFNFDGLNSWLRIADDGRGMDAATITESLRFGSERTYKDDDLGKFGLGLKTASLSQCRRILVASKTTDGIIEARRFDLDRIIKEDRWEVEILGVNACPPELIEPLQDKAGTVVLWSHLDRAVGTARALTNSTMNKALHVLWQQVEDHLSMVFHRFMEGDLGGQKVTALVLTMNNQQLTPWNPFAPDEPHTKRLPRSEYSVVSDGVGGIVGLEPFVLPSLAHFSSEAAWTRMGRNRWNQQQGLYIYRANRMIQSGGWSGTRGSDEHWKLARVALDFFPELDPAFGIDIAKMKVQLPDTLKDQIKGPIMDLIAAAKQEYTPKKLVQPAPKAKPTGGTGPARKPVIPELPAGGVATAGRSNDTKAAQWPPPRLQRPVRAREALEKAAEASGQQVSLALIVKKLLDDNAEVARVLGW